jgi:hypothetical protein
MKHWNRNLVRLLALAAAFALAGCGSDDDGINNPGGGGGDDFTAATVTVQAQTAAPQAAAMVGTMSALATGVGGKQGTYAWNATAQRWEYHYVYEVAGYDYDWLYTVQYLAGGTPQQQVGGADTVHHTMHGTLENSLNQGGYQIDYDYVYDYDVEISGVGTGTYTMTGTGGYDIDYSYVGNGVNQSADYVVDWETLGAGITMPSDGCASGTIRYHFPPYHTDVVFNGTGTATYTTYDGSNNVVAGGGGTTPVSCATTF